MADRTPPEPPGETPPEPEDLPDEPSLDGLDAAAAAPATPAAESEGWFDPTSADTDADADDPADDPASPAGRAPGPRSPIGLDESEFFAAERVFERLTGAVEGAQRTLNLAEVLRIQTVLALWSAMLLDEEQRGRAVHAGGVQERAFGIHLAIQLVMSRKGAISLLRDAIALHERLPVCWGAFQTGAFAWRAASVAVDASTGLTGAALADFDEQAVPVLTDLAPHQLESKLRGLRDSLDAKEAGEAAERACGRRRVTAAPTMDGQAVLNLHGPQTDIAAMVDALHQAAVGAHGREGETRAIGALMFDVAADLVLHGAARPPVPLTDPGDPADRLGDTRVPGRKAVQATLLVSIPAATACAFGDQPAGLAGWGALSAVEARRIVVATSHWTRLVVDPVDDAILAFDSVERHIPNGLRRLIQARDGTCRGPGRCTVPAHRADVDHRQRFEHDGRTNEVNLASLCRPEHTAKDEGYLDVRHRPDGSLAWRTRWGATVVTKPNLRVRRADEPDIAPPF